MDTPDTVTDAMRILEADGYRADFTVGSSEAGPPQGPHDTSQLVVRRTFRFEGDTDPGDEAIVLGVECPACGTRGIVVSAYGPQADPELLALLDRLEPGPG